MTMNSNSLAKPKKLKPKRTGDDRCDKCGGSTSRLASRLDDDYWIRRCSCPLANQLAADEGAYDEDEGY